MKPLLVLALLSVVIISGISQVYAENISVQTDKLSYSQGDIILVTGTVPEILEGFNPNFRLTAPNGNLVMIDQLTIGSDKKFNTSLDVGGSLMKVEGTYTILVQYGDNNNPIAETTFEYDGEPEDDSFQPPCIECEITDTSNPLQDEVDSLKSKNIELKIENIQLKNKINSLEEIVEQLQNDIQKLNKEFYEIILTQMTWFRDQITN